MFLRVFTNISIIVFCDVLHFTLKEPVFGWNYASSFSRLFLGNYLCIRFIYWTGNLNWVLEIFLHLKMVFQILSILILCCGPGDVLTIPFSFVHNFCSLLINTMSLPMANYSDNFRMGIYNFLSCGVQLVAFLSCKFAIISENDSTSIVVFTTLRRTQSRTHG